MPEAKVQCKETRTNCSNEYNKTDFCEHSDRGGITFTAAPVSTKNFIREGQILDMDSEKKY